MILQTNQTETNMTISAFDRAACKALRVDLEKILNQYAASKGITISVGNMSFSSEAVSIKMEAKTVGGKGMREQQLDSALKLEAMYDGLSLDVCNGKQLVGYNSRAHKMPYVYLDLATGKRFKTTKNQAKMYFTTPISLLMKSRMAA
jgi:hypothetical protein